MRVDLLPPNGVYFIEDVSQTGLHTLYTCILIPLKTSVSHDLGITSVSLLAMPSFNTAGLLP